MIIPSSRLEKFSMKATDDELGSIDDFYFDSDSFKVRYFVGDTRTWFFGGKVLLSPESFTSLDVEEQQIELNLTKEQIKNSPKPDEDAPVSRQFEQRLNNYYGWPVYWAGAMGNPTSAQQAAVPLVPPVNNLEDESTSDPVQDRIEQEVSLRSMNEIKGYTVHVKDGEIGKVSDFLLDHQTWDIRYLEINVGGFLQKEHIILLPSAVEEINALDKTITIDVEKNKIDNAPHYEDYSNLTREDEESLYAHYENMPYWK